MFRLPRTSCCNLAQSWAKIHCYSWRCSFAKEALRHHFRPSRVGAGRRTSCTSLQKGSTGLSSGKDAWLGLCLAAVRLYQKVAWGTSAGSLEQGRGLFC